MSHDRTLKLTILSSLVAVLCVFGGCGSSYKTFPKTTMNINGKAFSIEIARTDEEKSQGLMHRKSLGDFEGMIFVYPEYVREAFWMKNTHVPLSIAFITGGGKIVDIRDMRPLSEEPVQPGLSYMFALEVNRGTFDRLQVKVGDTLELPKELSRGDKS